MPGRNVIREYSEWSFYHVYNRGVNKRNIFEDDYDMNVFLSLLNRYLGGKNEKRRDGYLYPNYAKTLDLSAFCLMPNHFHLLVHQKESLDDISDLMISLSTSYTGYFNRQHDRVGHLFQGKFKAVKIDKNEYIQHITRYIHRNPEDIGRNYKKYPFSSYKDYTSDTPYDWVTPDSILGMFQGSKTKYAQFVSESENAPKIPLSLQI